MGAPLLVACVPRRRGDPAAAGSAARRRAGPLRRAGGRFPVAGECRGLSAARRRAPAPAPRSRSSGSSDSKLQRLARERVRERRAVALCRNWRSSPWRPACAVARVAGDRVADRGEVGADLVRAPGLEARLDQRVGRQQLEHLEVGAGLARAAPADRPPLRRPVVAAERRVDRPRARPRPPLDQRQVGRARPRGALISPRAGGAPRRRGRRPSARRCPCRAGGRSPAAPGPRRRRAARRARRPASVPRCAGAGWTTSPAGLSTTARRSSTGRAAARGSRRRRPAPARGASAASAITTTPSVIATSARLNAGHSGGSMKSVTAPSRTRSARLPSAPPASSPTPSHSPGASVSNANQPTISAEGDRRERDHERVAAARRRARTRSPLLVTLVELEAERQVGALAGHHRRASIAALAAWSSDTTTRRRRASAARRGPAELTLGSGRRRSPPPIESTRIATIGLMSSGPPIRGTNGETGSGTGRSSPR